MPAWAIQPFRDFIEYSQRLNQLMHLRMRGIATLQARPYMVKAVAFAEDTLAEPSTERDIQETELEAELAKREVDEGFPILHAQATVALWAALENTVRLFLARWLEIFPDAFQADAVQRLRGEKWGL